MSVKLPRFKKAGTIASVKSITTATLSRYLAKNGKVVEVAGNSKKTEEEETVNGRSKEDQVRAYPVPL
jgi:hypothetical protein